MAKRFNINTGKFEAPKIVEPPKDGRDGVDGVDGKDGKDGRDGLAGRDGADGKDGSDGVGIASVVQVLSNKAEIKLTNGESHFITLPKGEDAKAIEMGVSKTHIQWRLQGGEWSDLVGIPKPIISAGSGGGTRKVKDLRDTLIAGLTDGQALTWSDAAQAWVNATAGGAGAVDSVNGQTGVVVLDATDIGLGNVDNTSDLNKPVSTATQTALDAKQATLVSATNIKTINGSSVLGSGDLVVSGSTAWGGITGTLSSQTDLQTALDDKVNRTAGELLNPTLLDTAAPNKGWNFDFSGSFAFAVGTHVSWLTADRAWTWPDKNGTVAMTSDITGDVAGPASSTDEAIARFDSTTGKLLQDSSVKVTDNGSIVLPENSSPTASGAGEMKFFSRQIANRLMPAFIGPSGLDSALQPLLARNKVGYWCPAGNATTVPAVVGFTAPTITGFTATARNVATTNLFTRMRRLGYVSAATAAAVGNWRVGVYQYTVGGGSGLGGFTYIIRFGISDAAAVAGARMFMGMRSSATPANAEPSTLTNCIGIGHGAADTTMKLFYGGSAAQTPIDLGANFPSNTRNTDVYELALFSSPTSGDVHYEVTRINTGDVATGTITNSGATVLPTNTTLIAPWGYRTNNATALAVGLDVMSAYIETDV